MSGGLCYCENSQCDHPTGEETDICTRPPEGGPRGVEYLGVGTCCTECTDRYHAAGYGYTLAAQPLVAGSLPPEGRKLIVRGGHLGGSFTPVNDDRVAAGGVWVPAGGVYATFVGMTNGHATFQGRTADVAYLGLSDRVTWEVAP